MPLGRERLFSDAFDDYHARQRRVVDSLTEALGAEQAADDPRVLAFRRMQRQVRGLELLGSEEKLTDGTSVKVDENYLRESILDPSAKVREGYSDKMNSYKGQLSDEQIGDLIDFIKSLK